MFNDITKPPLPLPTTNLTDLEQGISLLQPLSRRGYGPGLVILVPDSEKSMSIIDRLPSQLIKWAEERYTVVEIQERALGQGPQSVFLQGHQSLD